MKLFITYMILLGLAKINLESYHPSPVSSDFTTQMGRPKYRLNYHLASSNNKNFSTTG